MGNYNRDNRSGGSGNYGRSDYGRRDQGGYGGGRGGRGGGPREMHDAVCSNCGNDCQVPFRPTGSKPVLCSNCFEKSGNSGNSRGGNDRRESSPPQSNQQIEEISKKLDKIIALLSGGLENVNEASATDVAQEVVEKEAPKKPKATTKKTSKAKK